MHFRIMEVFFRKLAIAVKKICQNCHFGTDFYQENGQKFNHTSLLFLKYGYHFLINVSSLMTFYFIKSFTIYVKITYFSWIDFVDISVNFHQNDLKFWLMAFVSSGHMCNKFELNSVKNSNNHLSMAGKNSIEFEKCTNL